MKNPRHIMFISLLLILTVFSTTFSANAYVFIKESGDGNGTEYWALLIGTDPEAYCSNDAEIMYDALIGQGWDESHIKILQETETTKENFLIELDWLDDNEDRNDVVIFFFSGHGGNRAIAFYDGYGTYNMDAYYLTSLKLFFNRIESKNFVLIFDTCMAGSLGGNKPRLARSNSLQIMEDGSPETKDYDGIFFGDLRKYGRIVITSCGKNEYSYGDDEFKNGIFTHFYAKGLSGAGDDDNCNGRVSIQEAFSYAKRKTEYHTSHHPDPDVTTMHPGMSDRVYRDLEITLPPRNRNDRSHLYERFILFQQRILILLEKVRALLG